MSMGHICAYTYTAHEHSYANRGKLSLQGHGYTERPFSFPNRVLLNPYRIVAPWFDPLRPVSIFALHFLNVLLCSYC